MSAGDTRPILLRPIAIRAVEHRQCLRSRSHIFTNRAKWHVEDGRLAPECKMLFTSSAAFVPR